MACFVVSRIDYANETLTVEVPHLNAKLFLTEEEAKELVFAVEAALVDLDVFRCDQTDGDDYFDENGDLVRA